MWVQMFDYHRKTNYPSHSTRVPALLHVNKESRMDRDIDILRIGPFTANLAFYVSRDETTKLPRDQLAKIKDIAIACCTWEEDELSWLGRALLPKQELWLVPCATRFSFSASEM